MSFKDLRFYYAILMRRLPLFLAVAGGISALGCLVALMLPSIYTASAKIMVEPPNISATLAPSTVQTNPIAQLLIYQQEIMTREHVLSLARKLDIYHGEESKMSEADIVDDIRKRTSFNFVDNNQNGDGAIVFSVSFEDRDPKIAASVVNDLSGLILQKNVRARNGRASETLQFFAGEVARLGDQLKELDQKVLSFTNEHHDALPDSLDFRRMQQSSSQERLQMLDWEEAGLRNRRNNLIQMFQATGQITKAQAITPEQQTLLDLKRNLSDQLVLFNETSPNIVALRTRIAALEKSIRGSAKPDSPDTAKPQRAASELDLQLSDIDQRLKFIDEQRKSIDKTLEKLAKSIAATPDNAMVLNALQRTRSNVQEQYSAAVNRYSEASTGKQIEADAQGERFTLVEPATPPHVPTWPHRKRIAAAAIILGIAAGAGLLVLLELLNKSIRRPTELIEGLQLQPIATIPLIEPDRRAGLPFLKYATKMMVVAVLGELVWISSIGSP